MAAVKVFVFILLAATACSALPSRIVGGSPTTVERYPSIVQVDSLGVFTNQWGQSCGASVLNNAYVLSAAHCFAGLFYQRERRRIRAGATYRNTGGVLNYIVREFNHPTYGQEGADGDISVVRLQNELVYTPVVQPGPIVNQGANLPDDTAVYHAGWGHTTEGGVSSPQLLDVTIYTVNFELCRQRYADLRPWPQTVTQNMICAGILDVGGKDACQGDSGGPLYYNNNGLDLLVGVVSWGEGCANDTYPGVSTKVSSYTTWIQNTAV